MARNKYFQFGLRAKKEGYRSIARIFKETEDNERAHAERLQELMEDKPDVDLIGYTVPPIQGTEANLMEAIEGEHYENTKMYPSFEKIARSEGEKEIADAFKEISEVEEEHEKRYRILLKNLQEGKMFKREKPIRWKCLNCGYVFEGTEAPKICPACNHPQSFYEVWCQPY
ncbi:MAG: rubrerythrin family protein [Candidatus Berkelbacteria bacterium]|nr:rubrerythrin family protein [Candidatus Berkelbacteria bacterium]